MALTHEEARFFKDKPDLYKEAKQRILEKWTADCKAWLTLEACKDACPGKLLDVLPLAFSFLQEHGVINIGAIQSPREHELPTTSAAEEEPKQPTKADIREKLYAILRIADFEVMTEKKIRAQLESELGIDMAPYRAWVRKHVLHVVNNMEERDTLAPLPLTDDDGDEGSNGAKGQQDCKGATTQTLPRAKDALPQDVVVIGAGLAGLVAANVLQRNGVKVIVLESQPHCGGRLAKLANGREAAAQSTAAVPTSDTGLAAAFGAIPLMIPVREASAVSSEGQAAAGALGAVGGWADAGSFTLTTLCRQLDISLNPLSVATSEGNGDVTEAAAWQPRLYERCMAAEGPQSGVEAGPRVIARQVQDEAEGLLVELLQAVRHRVDLAATAGSNCQPPLRVTLAEELRAALALAVVPIPQSGCGDDRYADASDSQLAGVKRSAAAAAESGVDAPRKLADGAQDDSSPEDILRSAKRSRGEEAAADRTPGCEGSIGAVQEAEGDGDGAANNSTGMPSGAGDGAPEGSGEAAATQPEGAPQQIADTAARNAAEGAPVVKTTDGQGAGDQARRSNSQEAGDDQEAPPSAKRHVRQEVLSVLHNHLLPLLELYLCAPLAAMAPDQLALLPYWLPGIGRPIGPALAGESTQQAPPGLLPAGAVSKLVGALAAQLSDVRTGVTVTSVTVTANGVKILTEAAGTLTAAAAILAVPHAVIQTGSMRIDPALPPYRAAAAARISCGCGATLTLVFPPGTNLSPLTAGAKASAAAFMVSSALPLDGADTTVAGGGPVPAGAAATTSSHPQRMGFMFCRMAAEESAESATRGEGEVVLTAHLVGTSAEQAASLSDEDLQRHAMTALQDAAAAAAADALPNAPVVTANELGTPLRCHVTRWGCDASTSSANASSRLTAAQRGSGCAHLGPGGHPRDMQLLALPHKARVFFAGEHTAPQHLRTGLMAAMAASGVREAARVLQALRSSATAKAGGATAKGKAAAAAAAVAAAASLAVWDERPHDELIAAAEAAAAALAARRGSEKDTGGKGSGSGSGAKRAAEGGLGTKGKVTGKKKDMDISDGDEDGSESAAAPKRRKQGDVEGAEQAGRKGKGKTDAASVDAKEKTKTKLASKGDKAKVEEDEDEDASGSGSSGSGSEAEDEEEEGAEEEEEEEATVGRGKKGKAKRGSSSAQERKQKDKKPTKEKEGKRRRGGDDNGNGSDGDSQDEEEAGAGKAETGKRAKGGRERKEDPVQLGILDKQRRQQALAKLQADRKDLKVVYKAMMAAGNGNMAPLREQMATSGGLDAKQLMLQALQGASMPVLQRLASDGQVHTVLKDWLLELSDEVSAEHLVLAELRFLERLPFSTDALTAALSPATTSTADAEGAEEDGDGGGGGGGSGDERTPLRALVTVVRERCGSNRGKDVKRLAAHLVASWERRVNATGGGLSTSGITTAAAAAAGAGSATTAPGPGGPPRPAPAKFDPRALVSLRKAALATAPTTTVPATRLTPPPAAARHTQSQGSSDAATGAGSTAAAEPTSGAPAAPALDPALEARLLAAKSAAEAARQEAALAAQRRAEVQQEAQAGASKRVASLPEIATFEDFKRFERVTGGINSVGEGASGKHHRESGSGSARPHKGSSGSGSGSATGGGSSDLEALKLEVLEFTKQLLRHHHKAGKITTAGYRLILDKASRKVFETLTPSSSSGSHGGSKGDLLGSKRREKIRKLVDQYVQKMGAQEGGAGVGGGSSGVGPSRASLAHVHEGSGGGVMDTGGETPLPPPPPPPPASLLPPPMSMTLQPSPSQLTIQLTMSSPIQLTIPPPPAPLTISPSPSQLTMSPPVQLTMPPPPAQLPLPPPSILITMPPPPPYLPPPPPGLV